MEMEAKVDERVRLVGEALWREDLAAMGEALRGAGAWPSEGGLFFDGMGEEELKMLVAVFVGLCRREGWPRNPPGALAWSKSVLVNGTSEAATALAGERKRRDMRRRSPEEVAEVRRFLGLGEADLGGIVQKVPSEAGQPPMMSPNLDGSMIPEERW